MDRANLKNGRPNPDHYGFGWSIEEMKGHQVIGHGGSWQGFKTHISRYVDDKLTVVVLINQATPNRGRLQIASRNCISQEQSAIR